MVFTLKDQAKYPFISEAADKIKKLNLNIENLGNPDFQHIVERAIKRIEKSFQTTNIQKKEEYVNDYIEILSFPIAIIMIAATKDNFIKQRFALYEAKYAYQLLNIEKNQKILEISKMFNWDININSKDISYDFTIYFTDFLKNTESLNEKWKLINRSLDNGQVFITKKEAARLLQEEIRNHILSKFDLSFDVNSILPEEITKKINNIKEKYARVYHPEEFPKEIDIKAYPPCINYLYELVKSGGHLSHIGRFTLTSFLINIGMKPMDVINLYNMSSDFNKKITEYQVEHIAGKKGSRIKYKTPNCKTLKTHGICLNSLELCKKIKRPLEYYRYSIQKNKF